MPQVYQTEREKMKERKEGKKKGGEIKTKMRK
jgi:hypothetical protein